jgi:hypothetical protein
LRIGCRSSRADRRRPRAAARGPGAGRTAVMVLATMRTGPGTRARRHRDPIPVGAAENTTPPFADRSGGPPSVRRATGNPPRRTAVAGRRVESTRIWTPVIGRRTARPWPGTGPQVAPARSAQAVVVAGSVGPSERYRSRSKTAATWNPARQDQEQERDGVAGRSRRCDPEAHGGEDDAEPPISRGRASRPCRYSVRKARRRRGDDHGGAVGHDLGHRAGEARRSRSASR